MASMRWPAAVAGILLAGCSSVSTPPEQYAAGEPPARELTPDQRRRVEALEERAIEHADLGRFGAAEDAAQAALEVDPRAARARAVLGRCLLHRSRAWSPPDLALQMRGEGECLLASRLAPADPVVGRFHAELLAGTGHLSAAAAVAEGVLLRQSAEPSAETLRLIARAADYRYQLGEERLAREHLLVLADHESDASTLYRLGICHLHIAETLDDLDAAARAFASSARVAGGDLEASLASGHAWLRGAELARDNGDQTAAAERFERAVEAFTEAASAFPAAVEPRFGRAVALEHAGRTTEARRSYEALLEVHPRHLGALLNLGALLARRSEDDPVLRERAGTLLRRALEVAADRPAASTPDAPTRDALTAEERRRIEEWLAKQGTAP